jgi:hypothetical protein
MGGDLRKPKITLTPRQALMGMNVANYAALQSAPQLFPAFSASDQLAKQLTLSNCATPNLKKE